MANVTIITPPQLYTLTQIASVAVPPIGAAYIASHLRAEGHEVTFVDGFGEAMNQFTTRGDHHLRGLRFEEILARIPDRTDLIGISNMFSHAWPVVRELAGEMKQRFPDTPIVSGGVHPSVLFDLVLKDGAIDYCVLGEGEATMAELAKRLPAGQAVDDLDGLAYSDSGQVHLREKSQLIEDLDRLPFPAYDMLPIENYITAKSPHGAARGRWLPLIATRGCPYRCTFCTAEEMWLPIFRKRTPENVVEEIAFWNEGLGITDFHFEDLTMVLDKVWTLAFANEMKRRNLKITWQMPNGTRSEPVDDEMIEQLKESGCTNITFAPESGSPTTLAKVKKELDLDTLAAACRRAVRSGMTVCCFFVVGIPH